ncbi:MAG: hypothetical protein WDN67_00600 [Candidatus Moraniibacteriota bacterium]
MSAIRERLREESERKKRREEIATQAADNQEQYRVTQTKGLTGFANRVLNRFGIGAPAPSVPSAPEEFRTFTSDINGANSENLNKSVGQNLAETFGAVSRMAKTAGKKTRDFLTESSTETAYDVVEQGKLDQSIQEKIKTNAEILQTLRDKNKSEKDSAAKERRNRAMLEVIRSIEELSSQAGGELKNKTNEQLLGQSLGTAIDLTPFLGFSSLGTRAAVEVAGKAAGRRLLGKAATRSVVKDATAEGALFGGASGASQSLEEGDSLKDVAKETAIGAGIGAAAGFGLSSILSRLSRPLADEVSKRAEEGSLSEEEVSFVYEKQGEEGVQKLLARSEDGEFRPKVELRRDYSDVAKDVDSAKSKIVKMEADAFLESLPARYSYATDWKQQFRQEFGEAITRSKAIQKAEEALESGEGQFQELYDSTIATSKSIRRKAESEASEPVARLSFKEEAPKQAAKASEEVTPAVPAEKPVETAPASEKAPIKTKEEQAQMPPKTEEAPKSPDIGEAKVEPIKGTGEKKTRGLSAGVEAKAVEKKLIDRFSDLPEYETVNKKDQAERVSKLMNDEYDRAERIALGDERPPNDILPESVFVAVEDKAIKDRNISLLRRLATSSNLTSEATTMGQRISMLAERDSNSAVKKMQEVFKERKKRFEEKGGKRLDEAKKKEVSEIKKRTRQPVPDKQDWESFVESIKC